MRFIAFPQRRKNNYSKCSAFATFALFAPIFHFKLRSFYCRGAQEYFLPQGAGYPSNATVTKSKDYAASMKREK